MKMPIVKFSKSSVFILIGLVALLAAISGTSAYAAHSNALPGSMLYPFKKAWEDVALFVAPTPAIKAQTYLNIAQNRIDAVKQSPTKATTKVIQQAQVHLQNALDETDKISDSKTRQEIKDDISKETSRIETEIETSGSEGATDQQDAKDIRSQNTQIQTEASKNN